MKIQPVLSAREPNYPRLQDFDNASAFLINNAPESWKRNKLVLTALISLSVSSQTCNKFPASHTRFEIIQMQENGQLKEFKKDPVIDSSFVAPLFNHGNGIGTFGCVVVMPPVFINEQEAKQIILNEFKKCGLIFDSTGRPGKKVVIRTEKKLWKESKGEYTTKDTTEFNELIFDGFNKELNLAFCFVSQKKYSDFTDYEPEYSSVSEENYKNTAEKLRSEIKKVNDVNAVVFYEPVPYPDWKKRSELPDWDEWSTQGKNAAVDSLKAQVADFMNWLKTEKITLEK
jgi:hypothetical protein